jgi:hypothetical protein
LAVPSLASLLSWTVLDLQTVPVKLSVRVKLLNSIATGPVKSTGREIRSVLVISFGFRDWLLVTEIPMDQVTP